MPRYRSARLQGSLAQSSANSQSRRPRLLPTLFQEDNTTRWTNRDAAVGVSTGGSRVVEGRPPRLRGSHSRKRLSPKTPDRLCLNPQFPDRTCDNSKGQFKGDITLCKDPTEQRVMSPLNFPTEQRVMSPLNFSPDRTKSDVPFEFLPFEFLNFPEAGAVHRQRPGG